MCEARPGASYQWKKGDTAESVAALCYGSTKEAERILRANPMGLNPGQTVYIPPAIASLKKASPVEKSSRVVVTVGGRQIFPTSLRATITSDTFADGFTAVLPYEPGQDAQLDQLLAPYSYAPSTLSIGGERLVTGRVYSIERVGSPQERTVTLEVFSATADFLDSSPTPPYEFTEITLFDLAKKLIEPSGIDVVYLANENPVLPKISCDPEGSIGEFLGRLARQHNILATCRYTGEACFLSPKFGPPVAILKEESRPGIEYRIRFDGRAKFHTYRATAQSTDGDPAEATVVDRSVPPGRHLVFSAGDTPAAELEKAAKARRSEAEKQTLSLPLPVESVLSPFQKKPWKVLETVSVVSPTLGIDKPFTFAITRTDFAIDPAKEEATLHLVPPEVLSGEEVKSPWGK